MLTAEKNIGEFFPQSGDPLLKTVHAERCKVLRSVRSRHKCNFQLIVCPLLFLGYNLCFSLFSFLSQMRLRVFQDVAHPEWVSPLLLKRFYESGKSAGMRCFQDHFLSLSLAPFAIMFFYWQMIADLLWIFCALVKCDLGYVVSPLWNHCLTCVPLTPSL